MNERIQELLFESNIAAKNLHGRVDTTKEHLTKFAELIIRECADCCHTRAWGMLEHNFVGHSEVDNCGYMIKEHFGVKE